MSMEAEESFASYWFVFRQTYCGSIDYELQAAIEAHVQFRRHTQEWDMLSKSKESFCHFLYRRIGTGFSAIAEYVYTCKVQRSLASTMASIHNIDIADQKRRLYNTVARKTPSFHGIGHCHVQPDSKSSSTWWSDMQEHYRTSPPCGPEDLFNIFSSSCYENIPSLFPSYTEPRLPAMTPPSLDSLSARRFLFSINLSLVSRK